MYVIARVRLAKDTRQGQTDFGFADTDSENGLPVGIVAFSNLADELKKYCNGSTIRISGMLKENNYIGKVNK